MKIKLNWGAGPEQDFEPSFGEDVFLAENSEPAPELADKIKRQELFEEIRELADTMREGDSEANEI